MAKKKKSDEMPGLFSAAEIRDLTPRIWRMWNHDLDVEWSRSREAMERHHRWALTLAWASTAALRDEASIVHNFVEILRHDLADRDRDLTQFVDALLWLARKPGPAREKALELLDSGDAYIERGLAGFLDPAVPAELDALNHLARHAYEGAAVIARKRLAEAGQLDWWRGHFESDPAVGLSETERAELFPRFHALIPLRTELAELRAKHKKAEFAELATKIVALVLTFPPRAAVLAAWPLLGERSIETGPFVPLFAGVSAHAGAPEMLLALTLGSDGLHKLDLRELVEKALPRLPEEFRRRASELLFAELERQPLDDILDGQEPADDLAEILEELWPDSLDPKPLLDRCLEWGAELDDYARVPLTIGRVIGRAGHGRPWARAAVEDGLAHDFEHPWAAISDALQRLAKTEYSDEERVALAQRTIERGARGEALGWAVNQLSEEERLARYSDPRVRPALFTRYLDGIILARARAELRQGRLDAFEAGEVAFEIGQLWGGIASYNWSLATHREGAPSDENDGSLERGGAWETAHGKELAGPMTDAEWAELRRLRAKVTPSQAAEWFALSASYPPGPWDAADKLYFDALLDHLIALKDTDRATIFTSIAAAKGAADHLERVETLERLDGHTFIRSRHASKWLRSKLGLPARDDPDAEPPAAAAEQAADEEW